MKSSLPPSPPGEKAKVVTVVASCKLFGVFLCSGQRSIVFRYSKKTIQHHRRYTFTCSWHAQDKRTCRLVTLCVIDWHKSRIHATIAYLYIQCVLKVRHRRIFVILNHSFRCTQNPLGSTVSARGCLSTSD